jgi:hypothetical protein
MCIWMRHYVHKTWAILSIKKHWVITNNFISWVLSELQEEVYPKSPSKWMISLLLLTTTQKKNWLGFKVQQWACRTTSPVAFAKKPIDHWNWVLKFSPKHTFQWVSYTVVWHLHIIENIIYKCHTTVFETHWNLCLRGNLRTQSQWSIGYLAKATGEVVRHAHCCILKFNQLPFLNCCFQQ